MKRLIGKYEIKIKTQFQVCTPKIVCSRAPCFQVGASVKVEAPAPPVLQLPGMKTTVFGSGGGSFKLCGPPYPLINRGDLFFCAGIKVEAELNFIAIGAAGFAQVKCCCSARKGCACFLEYGGHYKVRGLFSDSKVHFGGSKCIWGSAPACKNPWFG